ncbi:sigma factor-like helix-turn-helix DNA-binding protein, partial [Streptomyces sp. GLT-R25]
SEDLSGDTFDYTVDHDTLHLSVTDPMGHDISAGRLNSGQGVFEALAGLPPQQFDAVVLRCILQLKPQRIGWYMGISEQTVNYHCRQGKQRIETGRAHAAQERQRRHHRRWQRDGHEGLTPWAEQNSTDPAPPTPSKRPSPRPAQPCEPAAAPSTRPAACAASPASPAQTRTRDTAPVTRARRRLSVLTRLCLKDPQAARHLEELTACLGDDGDGNRHPPLEDLDTDGAQLFGCMLHLADHPTGPSSGGNWPPAPATSAPPTASTSTTPPTEPAPRATHWLDRLRLQTTGLDEEFLLGTARFTQWMHEHRPPAAHPSLLDEAVRLALHHSDDQPLVCRPERQIADRLHHLTARRA